MRRVTVFAGVCAILSSGNAAAALAQCPDGTPVPCGGRRQLAPANSVAVLYFESSDTTDRDLAAGLTEAIITRLADQPDLVVKSRYIVRRFQPAAPEFDPVALGRALNVAYVVTGAVQRAGRRLRITAELARSASGDRVWGAPFDRSDGDVFAIQEDIARAVAGVVAGRLQLRDAVPRAARPTRSNAAYMHFLRGEVLLAQRTPAGMMNALREYRAATELDPGFASAWARIGLVNAIRWDWGWGDGPPPPDAILSDGADAASRAIAMDSGNSDAWLAEGYIRQFTHPRDFEGSEPALRRAIALNPRNAEAWQQLGDYLVMRAMGDAARDSIYALARDAFHEALNIDPARPISLRNYALRLPPRERTVLLDSVLVLDPTNFLYYLTRGSTRLALGDTAGALADAARGESIAPAGATLYASAWRTSIAATAGDAVTARRLADSLWNRIGSSGPLAVRAASLLAAAYARLGDTERALDILQRIPPSASTWVNAGPFHGILHTNARARRIAEASRPPWVPAPHDTIR